MGTGHILHPSQQMSAVSREKAEEEKSGLEYDSMDLISCAYSAAGKNGF